MAELHALIMKGDLKGVEAAIAAGADLLWPNTEMMGNFAAHMAIMSGSPQMVQLLHNHVRPCGACCLIEDRLRAQGRSAL